MEMKIIQTFLGVFFGITLLGLIATSINEHFTVKSVKIIHACASMCRPSKVDVFEYDIESDEIKTCRCLR